MEDELLASGGAAAAPAGSGPAAGARAAERGRRCDLGGAQMREGRGAEPGRAGLGWTGRRGPLGPNFGAGPAPRPGSRCRGFSAPAEAAGSRQRPDRAGRLTATSAAPGELMGAIKY